MTRFYASEFSRFIHTLAMVMQAGRWDVEPLVFRIRGAIQDPALRDPSEQKWIRSVVDQVCEEFPGFTPPVHWRLSQSLLANPWLWRNLRLFLREHSFPELLVPAPQMVPVASLFTQIDLPQLRSPGAVAEWLGITVPELEWFADCRGWERTRSTPRLRHYHYRWLQKSSGRVRLIEIPKTRQRLLQRRIHAELLSLIPPHEAAHGFRQGRSIVTALNPHVGRRVVLHMDIKEFFPSLESRRVNALFRTVGYPEEVARVLTGLCTNSVPRPVLDKKLRFDQPSHRSQIGRYGRPHLPQGAPTSPALANLLARRLDARLSGLAAACNARYTRYADDLIFSGDGSFPQCLRRFRIEVCSILLQEGFQIQARKTRVMFSGQRQQVAGLVLNDRLNTTRESFDELRALLHNCRRFGPDSQNSDGHADFQAHIRGRIAWHASVNSTRGHRLLTAFERIAWPENGAETTDAQS